MIFSRSSCSLHCDNLAISLVVQSQAILALTTRLSVDSISILAQSTFFTFPRLFIVKLQLASSLNLPDLVELVEVFLVLLRDRLMWIVNVNASMFDLNVHLPLIFIDNYNG